MAKIDIPHLKQPIRFAAGGAAVVEQDSEDDIRQCVRNILVTPEGDREDLPDFGMEDQSFREGGADLDAIRDEVGLWEDRVGVLTDGELSGLVNDVNIALRGESA